MRPVIRTFSIIWAALAAIVALILIIVASSMMGTQADMIQVLVDKGMTFEEAQRSVASTVTVLFVMGFFALVSAIYCGIMAAFVMRDNIRFPVRLALSIVDIVLLALVPGILFLIDTIQTRDGVKAEEKEEPKPEEPAQ